MSSGHKSLFGRIIESWRKSGQPSTREVLHQHPGMLDKDLIMDLVLAEYKLRRDSGEQLAVTRFCDQFSTFRDELRELLHVENGIASIAGKETVPWPHPGETFLEFSLESILGVGAAARVYLARQTTLGNRLVALKVTPFGSSEAQTLGKLRHRNVVPVLSIHDDPARQLWAVCMPYLGSATLLDVRNHAFAGNRTPTTAAVILEAAARDSDKIKVPLEDAPRVLRQGRYYEGIAYIGAELAEGLTHTHSQGVLHRDLKPSNVLIASDGCPMLLDFNLAWDAQRESFRLGGTIPYMPPEQLYATFLAEEDEQLPDDPRSDVFSLGVILFELLTGRLPFPVDERADLPDTIDVLMRRQLSGAPNVRDLVPSIPRKLAQVISECLLVEVNGRPTPQRLAGELRRCGIRPHLRGKRSPLAVSGLVAAAAVGLLVLGLVFNSISQRHDLPAQRLSPRDEHITLAQNLLENEQFVLAAAQFNNADRLRHHWTLKAYEAYCYLRIGGFPQAHVILTTLVDEGCQDPGVLVNFSYTLMSQGTQAAFAAARSKLDQVLADDPQHVSALLARAHFNWQCPVELLDADGGVDALLSALDQLENPPASIYTLVAMVITRAHEAGRLDDERFQQLMQEQVTQAVAANYPRAALDSAPVFQPFRQQPWFLQLLERAAIVEQTLAQPTALYYCAPQHIE